ncbi:hypothetical protein EW145_g5553 [Phellinidium pouzarii]|uniref:F-box domain-containing protein n=1 Tax=Phellinidium pouzarii TaxID=167371 RepID=A0A4S4L4B8_9AGAM|nr:hypothetical protein EW145_g5553 [Phellinidium pouzarii]
MSRHFNPVLVQPHGKESSSVPKPDRCERQASSQGCTHVWYVVRALLLGLGWRRSDGGLEHSDLSPLAKKDERRTQCAVRHAGGEHRGFETADGDEERKIYGYVWVMYRKVSRITSRSRRLLDSLLAGPPCLREEGTVQKKLRIEDSVTKGLTTTRRSSRIRAKQKANDEAVSTQLRVDSGREKGNRARIASTNKPVTRRHRNSKVGRLEALMDIPVDVFLEISANMSSHDLLNMARSSKSLRDLLMSKDSKPIWRAARENVGLPDCPSDLSEPQFADLIFCKGCYFCNAPRAQTVHLALRLRLCKACSEKSTVVREETDVFDEIENKNPLLFELVPYDELYCFSKLYHIEQVKTIWHKYQSIELNPEELALFVAERKILVKEIIEVCIFISDWMSDQRYKKRVHQDSIGKMREEKIKENLKTLGYTEMDLDSTLDNNALFSKWRKLVKNPKMLTDRIWNNIRPQLVTLIVERQAWREELERRVMNIDHDTDTFCMCSECINDSDHDFLDIWSLFGHAFGTINDDIDDEY